MMLTVQGHAAYAYTGGKPFDPGLPCVVFVHGAVCDHGVWTLLARWAAHHGHAVLAVDLPGHMRSEGPALQTVEAMADWLLALLDAAGVQSAVLVGHSMGSLVALQAAAQAPERAAGLLMVGTSVPMPVPQALLDLSLTDVDAAIARVVGFSFSTLAAKPSYPGPGTWLRGAGRALMRQVTHAGGDPRLFHTDFSACNAYAQGLEAAARVRCPAALVLGAADQMTLPRAAQAVANVLKARVHALPAGHFPMQEAPDEVLNALRAELARFAGTRADAASPA
jgi:pimeloyl-ACP methyl ester carboxylesterase